MTVTPRLRRAIARGLVGAVLIPALAPSIAPIAPIVPFALAADAVAPAAAPRYDAPLDLAGVARRPAHGGTCVHCGAKMPEGSFEYQVRGVWVPLCSERCARGFASDPGRFLSRLLPRAALFSEEIGGALPVRVTWLAIALYVLLGLACGGVAAHVAVSHGLPRLPWFLAGLVGNLFALAFLAPRAARTSAALRGLAKIPATASPMPCSACARTNHPSASLCIHCGAALSPLVEPETRRVGR